MRALALLAVFIVAKLLTLLGRPIDPSVWTPIAYFWQDILVAGGFALLDRAIRRAWFGWALYGAAVAYVAINVPVARVLCSPLTWTMMGAARGTLADSVKHHATPLNLLAMFLVIVAGVAFPFCLRGLDLKAKSVLILPALVLVALGPIATARIETLGLDRNAIMALATTALPHISSTPEGSRTAEYWRASPLPEHDSDANSGRNRESLSRLRGSARGRNVVLISLESAGAQYLQPFGANRDPMPNLSSLARSALVFDCAYAVYPESIKGLFTVLCGRYPAMDTASEGYGQIRTPSLASVVKNAGYRTALFHSGRFMYLGMEAVVENRGYDVLEDAGAIGGNLESSFGVDEASTVARALAWIDSLPSAEHFFLTYLPIAGHHPYDTPEAGPFPEHLESDRYLNALHYADSALGSLIQGLRARGLEDSTLFVIFGDHGEAFGQHEGNFGHSLFLYEENVHVPYLIAAPGLIENQMRVGGTISLIDTGPTVLDLLGLQAPAEAQGESALAEKPGMALFYTDYSLSLVGLRDGCWKYLYEMDSRRSKLFDLCQDGWESKDLSRLHPDRVEAYRERLLRWTAAQKALLTAQMEGRQESGN